MVLFAASILFISKPHATIPLLMQMIDTFNKIPGHSINWFKLGVDANRWKFGYPSI